MQKNILPKIENSRQERCEDQLLATTINVLFIQRVGKIWEKVNVEHILYIVTNGSQTILHLTNKSELECVKNIGFFDFLTKKYNFFRIDQSIIVNLNHVIRYESAERILRFSETEFIYASRQKDRDLRKYFENIA